MNFIVIDGKKLGVLIVVIGLVVFLFGIGARFDSQIRSTSFIQSNTNTMKEFSALDNKITYKLPVRWETEIKPFNGQEILYHNNFTSDDNAIHGFVQVWNSKGDLKAFLLSSKEIAEKQNEIKDYNIKEVSVNGKSGYLVTYKMKTNGNVYYQAYEYFISDSNNFVRFSFYVLDKDFKEAMPELFKKIVNTLKNS
ncbi:MAG: PsbP-related protein [Bacillota bacterium]|nr:PsbP-related protein [Bacillota bacterium]